MLSLRINKIFLQRFSRCADQTYLHISARKSLLSETPLGNCFEMFIVFCSITDKKNRKKIYLRIYSAQFSDWNCKMLLLRRKDNFLYFCSSSRVWIAYDSLARTVLSSILALIHSGICILRSVKICFISGHLSQAIEICSSSLAARGSVWR